MLKKDILLKSLFDISAIEGKDTECYIISETETFNP